MSNNNHKPQAGAYRAILTKNLSEDLCTAFKSGNIKLGIVSTFTGNVITMPELNSEVEHALLQDGSADAMYYYDGLVNGSIAIVNNAKVDENNGNQYFRTGELYFRS